MGHTGAPATTQTRDWAMTVWDILRALSGLDDYVGQINKDRELVIKPKAEITPKDIVVGK
jgi:hypothetical protein